MIFLKKILKSKILYISFLIFGYTVDGGAITLNNQNGTCLYDNTFSSNIVIKHDVQDSEIMPGDVIFYNGAFKTAALPAQAQHAGVYLGNNQVIERVLKSAKMLSLHQFRDHAPDHKIHVLDLHSSFPNKKVHSLNKILEIAQDYMTGRRTLKEYSLEKNNCQHFATLLVLGEKISWQVDNINIKATILDAAINGLKGLRYLFSTGDQVLFINNCKQLVHYSSNLLSSLLNITGIIMNYQ